MNTDFCKKHGKDFYTFGYHIFSIEEQKKIMNEYVNLINRIRKDKKVINKYVEHVGGLIYTKEYIDSIKSISGGGPYIERCKDYENYIKRYEKMQKELERKSKRILRDRGELFQRQGAPRNEPFFKYQWYFDKS